MRRCRWHQTTNKSTAKDKAMESSLRENRSKTATTIPRVGDGESRVWYRANHREKENPESPVLSQPQRDRESGQPSTESLTVSQSQNEARVRTVHPYEGSPPEYYIRYNTEIDGHFSGAPGLLRQSRIRQPSVRFPLNKNILTKLDPFAILADKTLVG